jgi:putative transposase
VKYRCIQQHRRQYALGLMCGVLGVSRSGYYAWTKREPSRRRLADRQLLHAIREIHAASSRRYGSPRVHGELRERGIVCSRERVARLMRAARLQGIAARRRKPRVLPVDRRPLPHRLQRDFAAGVLNRVWAADLTYVRTAEGWLFLAVVMDVGSRRVIGWAMRNRPDVQLVINALDMALASRKPAKGTLHHSDRGMHYTSLRYRKLLEAHGLQPSFSRLGNCWDNAVVESFFHTLKTEQPRHYSTRREARAQLFEFIEVWYNRQRRHSTLDSMSPAEFECRLQSCVH